jgi:hypothetical protein
MSLTQGLSSPRTPLRRFLDRELSAGARPLRATYRARLPIRLVLPGDGVGYEAGTVGTAIDQRLRLAFTSGAPVDAATMIGVDNVRATGRFLAASTGEPGPDGAWDVMEDVGQQMTQQLRSTVTKIRPDDRTKPIVRAVEEEEHLARLLLAAAWYALNCRNPVAFPLTPLCKSAFTAPHEFTLEKLLALPHPHLVEDMLAQLQASDASLLKELRDRTTPADCQPGPTFDGSAHVSADADLIAGGTLIDFKSTRRVHYFSQVTIQQLLGYVLMDYSDQYKIDTVGIHLTRAGALISWPLEDYLALLGARRRDLPELRAAFTKLLSYTGCRADDDPLPEQLPGLEQLLAGLAAAVPAGCCRVCAQPLIRPFISSGRPRLYCSQFCAQRSGSLRRRGWLG